MTKDDAIKIVTDALVDSQGVIKDEVKLESKLIDDLGLDSMDEVELGITIEEILDERTNKDIEFDLDLSIKARKNRTVNDLVEMVMKYE